MNVTFSHFSPKFECETSDGQKINSSANTKYFFGDSKPMTGYTTGSINVENRNLKSVTCRYTYDSSNYPPSPELAYLFFLPPSNSFISDKQPYFYYEEDRQKLECKFDVEVQCK